MTNQEKLQYIKSRVAEACLEVDLYIWVCSDYMCQARYKEYVNGCPMCEKNDRRNGVRQKDTNTPLTLSHILRTINKVWEDSFVLYSVNTRGVMYGTIETEPDKFISKDILSGIWNLEKDNLNDQSEATIDFLYTLLK